MYIQLSKITYDSSCDVFARYIFTYTFVNSYNPTRFIIKTNTNVSIHYDKRNDSMPFDEFIIFFKEQLELNKHLN